jgi:hypothetical protein
MLYLSCVWDEAAGREIARGEKNGDRFFLIFFAVTIEKSGFQKAKESRCKQFYFCRLSAACAYFLPPTRLGHDELGRNVLSMTEIRVGCAVAPGLAA